jgi:hypothetical protein
LYDWLRGWLVSSSSAGGASLWQARVLTVLTWSNLDRTYIVFFSVPVCYCEGGAAPARLAYADEAATGPISRSVCEAKGFSLV